jgi:hypothetical protein
LTSAQVIASGVAAALGTTGSTVTVSDTGANINTNIGALVTAIAAIDKIDATDSTAIVLTEARATSITNAKLTLDDTVVLTDASATIKGANGLLAAAFANVDSVDSTDALGLTLAQLTTITNAKLTASDVVTVTLADTNNLPSILNIDKVTMGVSATTGAAEANLAAVNGVGKWYFDNATDTLSYHDTSVKSVVLTGASTVTCDGSGIFTIA